MKRRYLRSGLAFVSAFMFFCYSYGQEMKIKGGFLTDTIRVGEVTPYALSFTYPSEWEVVFPDSTYNFYPFEFVRKDYFPTKSTGSTSYDSAVYYLTTFELEERAPLALPVFIAEGGDSSAVFAERDTLTLQETVTFIPDSVALKDNASYRKVDTAFNYPYFLIGVFIVFLAAGLIFVFFGRQIMTRIKLYRLKKDHKRFVERFEVLLSRMNGQFSRQAEMMLIEWKKYLEQLENKPFTKLTTREISTSIPDQQLEATLKIIDRSIYGGVQDDRLKQSLQRLVDYSANRYRRKIQEVKYGK